MPASKKYVDIAAELERRISGGALVGQLPTVRALAHQFSVNPLTVQKAIGLLAERGAVYTIPTKGIYARGSSEDVSRGIVGLLMRGSGHFFGAVTTALTQRLQADQFMPVALAPDDDFSRGSSEAALRRLLALRPVALASFGMSSFPFDLLARMSGPLPQIVLLHCCETELQVPTHQVLSDLWQAAYLATDHLLALGHQRVMMLTHKLVYPYGVQARRMAHYQAILGYRLAMEKRGLEQYHQVYYGEGHAMEDRVRSDREGLRALFSSPDHPTAVFALGDWRARELVDVLLGLGVRVPDDVAVIGCYDTQWAQSGSPMLTSVSLQEDELAEQAARWIDSPPPYPARHVVVPRLVIRESCGAVLEANTKGES